MYIPWGLLMCDTGVQLPASRFCSVWVGAIWRCLHHRQCLVSYLPSTAVPGCYRWFMFHCVTYSDSDTRHI